MKDYPKLVTEIPGPKSKAIVARDETWTSTCYIKEYPLVVSRASGAMVEDVDGNRFLDFMAGIAVASTGHAHPAVVKAIQEAAGRFLHICGSDFYYESMAQLAEKLATIVPGPSKKRVFLSNSGTEAVEGAMKLARYYTGRTDFIAFKGAFHGRTYGAVSMTSSKVKQHSRFGPFLPGVHHVPFGYCYRCDYGKTYPACGMHCVNVIEKDLFARHVDPENVAAIFVEPVQGEGGYIVPPKEFLPQLRALCDKYGILLVCDEIQSGLGRTGAMFATDLAGIEPDIITVAKGLASGMPIGAFVAKESISTWGSGSHGSTFGGNPVSCAAALATIDLVEGQYLAHARKMGNVLMAGVRELAAEFPVIGEVRGLGLMIGIEFVKDRTTREQHPELVHELVQRAFRKGVLLLAAGKSALRLAPPLVIDEEDAATALGVIRDTLRALS
ncbi:MAG: acetyl ornithine aminotransferase family protein [Gemmatimonadales bacterium]